MAEFINKELIDRDAFSMEDFKVNISNPLNEIRHKMYRTSNENRDNAVKNYSIKSGDKLIQEIKEKITNTNQSYKVIEKSLIKLDVLDKKYDFIKSIPSKYNDLTDHDKLLIKIKLNLPSNSKYDGHDHSEYKLIQHTIKSVKDYLAKDYVGWFSNYKNDLTQDQKIKCAEFINKELIDRDAFSMEDFKVNISNPLNEIRHKMDAENKNNKAENYSIKLGDKLVQEIKDDITKTNKFYKKAHKNGIYTKEQADAKIKQEQKIEIDNFKKPILDDMEALKNKTLLAIKEADRIYSDSENHTYQFNRIFESVTNNFNSLKSALQNSKGTLSEYKLLKNAFNTNKSEIDKIINNKHIWDNTENMFNKIKLSIDPISKYLDVIKHEGHTPLQSMSKNYNMSSIIQEQSIRHQEFEKCKEITDKIAQKSADISTEYSHYHQELSSLYDLVGRQLPKSIKWDTYNDLKVKFNIKDIGSMSNKSCYSLDKNCNSISKICNEFTNDFKDCYKTSELNVKQLQSIYDFLENNIKDKASIQSNADIVKNIIIPIDSVTKSSNFWKNHKKIISSESEKDYYEDIEFFYNNSLKDFNKGNYYSTFHDNDIQNYFPNFNSDLM